MNRPRSDADRRLRQSWRVARAVKVLTLVQGAGPHTARSLAAELECSERTVYRDMQVLELAGVPIHFEPECGYRLSADARFPVIAWTAEEALGQALSTVIAETANLNPGRGSRPTTQKLAARSPASIGRILADAEDLVAVLDLKLADHRRHRQLIRTIQDCLLKRTCLKGVYRSPREAEPLRLTLHPYRLCFLKQAWYVVGRADGQQEPRTYRVHRFDPNAQATATPSQVPPDFDLKAYFGLAWSVFRGEPRSEIELHFQKAAVATVSETVWHSTQAIKKHRDGSATLTFTLDGLNEIVRWVLGWAGQCRVVRPAELRRMVEDRFRAGLELQAAP